MFVNVTVGFQSPQWGDNSKDDKYLLIKEKDGCFSPRNGEIILKEFMGSLVGAKFSFSPRNGEIILKICEDYIMEELMSFSPRNGEIILKLLQNSLDNNPRFQSPQWGDNSKAPPFIAPEHFADGFSPRNGEIILKW